MSEHSEWIQKAAEEIANVVWGMNSVGECIPEEDDSDYVEYKQAIPVYADIIAKHVPEDAE